jgi:trehalose 6-phosphate synthase
VTLPRPDLPMVLLSHHGPVSSGRDESGRTASRGAGGPVTALIGAHVGPPRRRLGMRGCHRRGPAVVGEHDHKVFGVTLEPEPRLLDQADVRGC